MPKQVPIEVFMIGRTEVDREEVKKWLAFIGADGFEMPDEETVSNPALLIALAGKRCYKSFTVGLNPNISKIRADYADYFDNILKSGHGSVLEHSVYTFAIENVSRVFTGEMNRHRAGWAISEGSMRFIRYSENIPYWEPTSIQGPSALDDAQSRRFMEEDPKEILKAIASEPHYFSNVNEKKEAHRIALSRTFCNQEDWYRVLEVIWKDELAPASKFSQKKELTSCMRRGIGMGVATGGVWTGNIRALRHVITMRASQAAEEEILYVFSKIAKMIKDREPLMFGDFAQDENGYWAPHYVKV